MEPSDEELVAAVVAMGDREAFTELVRRHQRLVRGMLRRLCRNRALSDDLAQETFLQAYCEIGRFSGRGSFRSWLCRIAYTEFLQAMRRRKATERTLERFAAEAGEAETVRDGALGLDLDRMLGALREEERTAVVLCYACGLSHPEAARITGWPLGTLKSHVNRGREKLKAMFAEGRAVA